MSDLGPINEDVRFDHGAAERLISQCNSAASTIEGQAGSRASWVSTAKQDFAGHFSELFSTNAQTASADASEIATRLRDVARFTTTLAEEARSEQERREVARQWQQEQDDRSMWDKGVDTVGGWLGAGEEKPPVGPMPEPSSFTPSPVSPAPRQTPSPGSGGGGGGGGGTSSARPENLRSFASGSSGANGNIRSKPATTRSTYNSFVAGCGWGSLEASDVFVGFDKYVDANEEDVRWARTVADAFEAAGSEGGVSTLSNSALAAALRAADVDATRDDIVVDPPTAYGSPPTSGYADDPVNAATGNFLENEADLAFTGGCSALALTRTYNSFDTGAGAFGTGWSSWTEAGLELTDEAARLRLPDGRVTSFARLGAGWDRASGESRWLERTADGRLRATDNDGEVWTFSAAGALLERSRGTGTAVRLERDADGRVVRLAHERGRWVDLAWEGERVVAATTSDGRRADYDYDGDRLVAVTTARGTRRYGWDDAGLVATVTDADGVVEVSNAYDAQRRVVRQRSPHGRTSRFVYLPGHVTVVSDEDGTRSNTWISDHCGRVIGIVDADEQRQSTSYDSHGNPVLVTERDGTVTVHEYDDRGRKVRTVTPSGADLTFGHDEHDRVTTVVTESGAVTTYSYEADDARNPSVMTDPEGGETRYTWEDGALVAVTDPVGVSVRFGYDEHGDLVSTTDAFGNTARLERDGTGRVRAAVTPAGQRTTWTYAPSGLLASRQDPDGAVWRFEHTTAGRLSAMVDPTGARTEIERGEDGEETRTIDPLGRAVTRRVDDLGNVSSMELPDGSRWEFAYDAMSRRVATTDPTGATWAREHDVNGAITATVDPTGVRHGLRADRASGTVTVDDGQASIASRFDPLGRLTATEQADGSAVLSTYDRCGRPVELLDAEGGLTRIERDAAGRAVAIISPTGLVTRREHDACGRLAAVVDAQGGRVELEHDADGRVVRQVLPSGEVVRIDYDACGRVVARHVPGRGVVRVRYDAAGRVAETSDTWHGRRRFRHDAAGQLVEVVNGNGGVTRYDYDANGRAVAITDPLGHTTRREFDAMNRCVAETDPLGRTTRAGYDSGGRISWQTDPEGRRTEWTYDEAGRLAATSVDGREVASLARDLRARRVTVTDHTRADGREVRHELAWDRRGRLVSRSRDGEAVSWTYDAEGRRTSMTTPDGRTTRYEHDGLGRVVAVDHPLLGRAVLERDASGRVTSATSGSTLQTWEHRDGFVVAHTVTDLDGSRRTVVSRGDDGRITAVDRDGTTTTYDHDEARQLVAARTGSTHTTWRYDAAGRLVAESLDGATREHSYDDAGQLLASTTSAGTTRHTYDGLGRRTRTEHADGRLRDYTWSSTGWLAGVTTDRLDGGEHLALHVDALGELAEVSTESSADGTRGHTDTPLWWDTAGGHAPNVVQAGSTAVVSAGPAIAVGEDWRAAGWRSARADGADPWRAAAGADLPGGLAIGPSGELTLGGDDPLEWLGARAYDPASRGFLSVDPFDPVVGAGWSGNPYSYAGNDPLHSLDPTGLRPLTDAELNTYIESTQGFLHAAGEWAKENWEYVAAGAMVIGGAALMFAPVPGAQLLGAGLISAGIDTAVQKATTGEVNWGQVAVSGAAGMIGGGAGALAMRGGATVVRSTMIAGATEGAVGGFGSYATGPGPHTPAGFMRSTAMGTATGLLPVPGGAGNDVVSAAGRNLADVPSAPFMPPNPGSLSDEMAGTFRGGQYQTSVLAEDRVLYRAGTEGTPLGQFFSSEPPAGVTQTRIDKAIPEAWPDGTPAPLDTGYAINVPAGTTIHTGDVANQGGIYMGGTEQIVVERPWEIEGVGVVDSWPLH